MGSTRLRQGPQQQHRVTGILWRSTLLGLVLGVALLGAAPGAASAAPDVALTKSASPGAVFVGEQITYDLTVTNNGPDDATAVQLTDTLPAEVAFETATSSQGTCSEATGTVTCDLGPLANGGSATAQIKVHATAQGQATNQAAVSTTPADPNPADNSASAQTTVNPVADLALTATDVPDPVVAGELLTYSLVVKNNGPSDAAGVSITDTLPAGVNFAAAPQSCLELNGTVTCKVDALASGQSATLDIAVRPRSAGTITNAAQASSSVHDPDPANDTASVQTTVLPPPPSPGPSTGTSKPSSSLNVVISGSYVLISGRSVKLVKGKLVPVKLTCAGQRKCEGSITVASDKPVETARRGKGRKPRRRVVRLGRKKFSIEGNRQQRVLVPLSKSNVGLLRRLKRVKARVTIREIDVHGHLRVSTRTFMLRAR
jgi:uncharacterized repeat protein (TIGR01451 family)